jgi:hypothetical protein
MTPTPAPPAHSLVNSSNELPPDSALWVVTIRGYTQLYSRVPLADALQLHALPFHPLTTPPSSQCRLATMDPGSPLPLVAGALAKMQLHTNAPTTFLLPNRERLCWKIPWSSTVVSTTTAPCPHQFHLLRTVNPSLLHPDSTRTTSDSQGQSKACIN